MTRAATLWAETAALKAGLSLSSLPAVALACVAKVFHHGVVAVSGEEPQLDGPTWLRRLRSAVARAAV